LSDIDAAGLARASAAIAVMFGQLGAAFVAFNKISSGGSAVKVGVMAAGLILLAVAVRILAGAAEKLAGIPIENLQKGLIALGILLGTIVAASNRLNTVAPGMIRTSAGLVILAAAIRLLVESVEELGKMNWNELSKGLVGVASLLAALALFTRFAAADKGGITQGAGIVLLATGLKILASAVKDFTQFNWEQIARGMGGIAIGLGLITAAMNLLPEGSVFKAAGVLIVATSLQLIADGVKSMSGLKWDEIARGMTVMAGALISIAIALRLIPSGSLLNAAAVLVVATSLGLIQDALGRMSGMTWEQIAKGLTVLAASLILIAGAVRVMQGALSGAAAIIVVAAALRLLLPVLTTLGDMTWEEIIKGLVGLAGVFVIIGVATLVLAPLVPVIFSLAAAIGLLSLSVLAAGVGVLAFATGLTILAAAGTGAVAAIVGIVAGLVGLIPYVMEQIALGLVAFAKIIATSGPAILEAITTVMNALLDAIISVIPKIVQVIIDLISQILEKLAQAVPRMVDSGMRIIVGFLRGVADHMGEVVDQGVRIIVALLDGIGRNAGKIIQAAVDLVFNFINGIADAIRNNATRVVDAGWNIASALIEGVVKGIGHLVSKAVDAAIGVAKRMWDGITDFFSIFSPSKKMIWMSHMLILGVDKGLEKYGHIAVDSAVGMSENMVDSMAKTLTGLSSVLGSDLIDFNPTIAPVLDLTQVKREAQSLNDILGLPEFDMTNSASSARNANSGFENNRNGNDPTDTSSAGSNTYNYIQYNSSPKALSEAEIYRQTNNLISKTKKGEN
jgi:phage-related protein